MGSHNGGSGGSQGPRFKKDPPWLKLHMEIPARHRGRAEGLTLEFGCLGVEVREEMVEVREGTLEGWKGRPEG